MKQNNRFCVLALTAVLAPTLTACSETADGSAASGSTQTTQPAQSTAQQDTSAGTPSASQQTEVLGSLTSSELQELVSGSTTLEQLTQQRAEAADPGTGSTTALPEYEQQLQALINQLYAVKARAESSLNNTIQSATAEYKALPAAKQTKSRKIAIVMGKASELKAMEASCDKEVDDIVNQMRALLTQNGQSTALARRGNGCLQGPEEKSEMVSSLTSNSTAERRTRFPCNLCRNIPGTRCRVLFAGEILFLSGSRVLQLRSGFCSTLHGIRSKIIARVLLPFVNFANLLHIPVFFPILLELWGHTV